MILSPDIGSSIEAAVTATAAALSTAMAPGQYYMVASSTNCWIKQGSAALVTCVSKANSADTDYVTITVAGAAKVYEFDKTGDGVTAGRVLVDIHAATTAADVAAILRTAILANQAMLAVLDNSDGTLTVTAPNLIMTITENVANAGFTIASATVVPTAATGSMFVPALYTVFLDGVRGPQCGILRDTADGKASLTRTDRF